MKFIMIPELRIQVPETAEEMIAIIQQQPDMLAVLAKASAKFAIKEIVTDAIEHGRPVSETEADRIERERTRGY